MTFLELEKKCKKRRLIKRLSLLFVFAVFTAFASAGFFIYKKTEKKSFETNFNKKIKIKKTDIPETSVKTEFKQKTEKEQKLKLFLDLNTTCVEKNISVSVVKKQKTLKASAKQQKPENMPVPVIQTQTLPSFETCMELAEKYYNEGDYENALNWAKNANLQNNKKPESWIMSAKALVKLGKRQEAVKILKIYYNYHKDERIKKLLGELDERDK